MYWTVTVIEDFNKLSATFEWKSANQKGRAYIRVVQYAGGDTVHVSGPKIRTDGSVAFVDGAADIPLTEVPVHIRHKLITETHKVVVAAGNAHNAIYNSLKG